MRKTNLRFQEKFASPVQKSTRLKIGEVSQLSGIGIEALRFYERSGLLGKPVRSANGYRLFDEGVIERLAFIKKAQTLGFSLDEIGQIIKDARSGESPCDEVREIVRRRLAELDERMREMKRYRKELAQTLAEWDEVGHAPGHICGLIEATELKIISQPRHESHRLPSEKRLNEVLKQ